MNKINTKKYEPIIKKVIIDNREQDRVDYAMEQYAPFNPSVEQLLCGDYLFVGEDGTEIVFEYKTGNDFLSSIDCNNHLHNQVYEMTKNYQYTFVIIETESLSKDMDKLYYSTGRQVTYQLVNGVISDLSTVTNILQCQTIYQAFDLMMRTAGKLITNKPFRYNFDKKDPNTALNVLSTIHGLNDIADNIVNTLNLHTIEDVLTLTREDLMTVNGVGKVKADNIISEIGSELKWTINEQSRN